MTNELKEAKAEVVQMLDSYIGVAEKFKSKVNSVDESLPEEEGGALLMSYMLMLQAETNKIFEGE